MLTPTNRQTHTHRTTACRLLATYLQLVTCSLTQMFE